MPLAFATKRGRQHRRDKREQLAYNRPPRIARGARPASAWLVPTSVGKTRFVDRAKNRVHRRSSTRVRTSTHPRVHQPRHHARKCQQRNAEQEQRPQVSPAAGRREASLVRRPRVATVVVVVLVVLVVRRRHVRIDGTGRPGHEGLVFDAHAMKSGNGD